MYKGQRDRGNEIKGKISKYTFVHLCKYRCIYKYLYIYIYIYSFVGLPPGFMIEYKTKKKLYTHINVCTNHISNALSRLLFPLNIHWVN